MTNLTRSASLSSTLSNAISRGAVLVTFLLFGMANGASAERLVLAPQGETLPSSSFRTEYLISPYRHNENLAWLQLSSPIGIEMEFQRVEEAGDDKKRYSLNVQYPLAPELGRAPSLSLGVRDLTTTGQERMALYLALGKTLRLSNSQRRLFKEIRLSGGFGTGRMNGLFGGAQVRLRSGLELSLEIYRQHPNFVVGLPMARNLQARAYSLDGTISYGLAYGFSW